MKPILKEIFKPFVDLVHAPRALWGVNLGYFFEGLSYFGMLTYLAIFFSDFVFKGVGHADIWSHYMVMTLTAGVAIAMVVLGFIPDKIGIRWALILSFILLLAGRAVMSSASTIFGLMPGGIWSPLHITIMAGMLLVIVSSGVYQPAAYSAVRHFTTPQTSSMAYAMLYALMNGGSSLTMLGFLLRDDAFCGFGIAGTFWVYTGVTFLSLLVTLLLLSKKTVNETMARAKEETAAIEKTGPAALKGGKTEKAKSADGKDPRIPISLWILLIGALAAALFRLHGLWRWIGAAAIILVPLVILVLPRRRRSLLLRSIADHPLANTRFFYFIFALIPVQTLFTYNWLVLPQYVSRAFGSGWIGKYYEIASNVNPILIFFFVPVITALTYKKNIYTMMIAGTLVMGSSAFALAFGPHPWTLGVYLLLMTIGEAMWSARFLQYATEIAPEGRAGQYQGVAQLPWFLTKFLVPLLYSGQMMERYCPANGEQNTQTMWLIFGLIAIISPLALWAARGWMVKQPNPH